jgi:hypothetical protein
VSPQVLRGVIMLDCLVDGRSHVVVLDYADRHTSINKQAMLECSLYFKMQFQSSSYADARIVPGGYASSGIDYYRYYRPLRRRFEGRRRIDVLGRFGHAFQGELRRTATALLSEAADIDYVGRGKRVRYGRFLEEAASARLSIDLPGNGPFTYRVVEFLGLGTCLVAPRYPAELNVPLIPGKHYVPIADDLSDLVDVCRYYLAHDEERESIAAAGQDFFDRYLHCDELAGYYIRTILDRLGSTNVSS